jgi:hypothetical protein
MWGVGRLMLPLTNTGQRMMKSDFKPTGLVSNKLFWTLLKALELFIGRRYCIVFFHAGM